MPSHDITHCPGHGAPVCEHCLHRAAPEANGQWIGKPTWEEYFTQFGICHGYIKDKNAEVKLLCRVCGKQFPVTPSFDDFDSVGWRLGAALKVGWSFALSNDRRTMFVLCSKKCLDEYTKDFFGEETT